MSEASELKSTVPQENGELRGILLEGEGLRNLSPKRLAALGEIVVAFGLDLRVLRESEPSGEDEQPQRPLAVQVDGEFAPPTPDNLTLVGFKFTTDTGVVDFDGAIQRQRQVRQILRDLPDITGKVDLTVRRPHRFNDEAVVLQSPEEQRLQQMLNGPVVDMLPKLMSDPTRNLEHRIKKAGFETLVDILVGGTERFIGNKLGIVSHNIVQDALRTIDSTDSRLTIKEKPTMADIVQICPSLDKLPAFLIDDIWNYRGKRLVDVITMPQEQLLEFIGKPEHHHRVLQEGRRIALEYLLEQEKATKEQEAFRILNVKISDHIGDFAAENIALRAYNALSRDGIHTLAHILIAGKAKVYDSRNFGDKAKGAINGMMESFGLMDDWKVKPTMANIASYCPSLDKLPAFLIPDIPGRCLQMNFNDILAMQTAELADFGKVLKSDVPDLDKAEVVKNKAQEMAGLFLAERRKLVERPTV